MAKKATVKKATVKKATVKKATVKKATVKKVEQLVVGERGCGLVCPACRADLVLR